MPAASGRLNMVLKKLLAIHILPALTTFLRVLLSTLLSGAGTKYSRRYTFQAFFKI